MSNYDPDILESLAKRSDRLSRIAIFGGVATGIIFGGLLGFAITLIYYLENSYLIPGAVGGAAVGVAIGRQRSMTLKLQAQTAFCLIKIEKQNSTVEKPPVN